MASTDSLPKRSADTIAALRMDPGCRFIGPREFCDLITSNKNFERCDQNALSVRGVRDVSTGVRFFIEEENLFRSSVG